MQDGGVEFSKLGLRFQQVRKYFGIEQQDMAEELGINPAILSKFENGGMVYARVLLDVMFYFRNKIDLNFILQPGDKFSLDDPRAFIITYKQLGDYSENVCEEVRKETREKINTIHQEVDELLYNMFEKLMMEG